MKFTVEVEEFWLEEEELSTSLKEVVKNDVIVQIKQSIQNQVNLFMDRHIRSEITLKLNTRIEVLMEEFIKTGKVQDQYNRGQALDLSEWMAKQVTDKTAKIHEFINASATAKVNELKARYDLLFASQIVTKLNEQGMLKENIAQILLADNK